MNGRTPPSLGKAAIRSALVMVVAATDAGGQPTGKYLGPCEVTASADGRTLFVLNAGANQVTVLDGGGRRLRSVETPAAPTGAVLRPDGATLYVTCAGAAGVVCAIDATSGKLAAK